MSVIGQWEREKRERSSAWLVVSKAIWRAIDRHNPQDAEGIVNSQSAAVCAIICPQSGFGYI